MRKFLLKRPQNAVLHDIFRNFVSIFNVHELIAIMLRIPTITKNLLIINVLAFLAGYALKSVSLSGGMPIDLNDVFGLHFFLASDFKVYQLITYMFMHANLEHIFFNKMYGDQRNSFFITFLVVSELAFFRSWRSSVRSISPYMDKTLP